MLERLQMKVGFLVLFAEMVLGVIPSPASFAAIACKGDIEVRG